MKSILRFFAAVIVFQQFLGCRGENTLGPDVAAILGVGSSNNETNTTTTTTTGTTSTPVIATTAAPFSGHHFSFNYTGNDQFCILMDVSTLELEITYPTWDGTNSTVTFKAPATSKVNSFLSHCGYNLTDTELDETLAVEVPLSNFPIGIQDHATIEFHFTRDPSITGDKTLDKSQLYKIVASYSYDRRIFPNVSKEEGPKTQIVGQNVTLKEFVVLKDRSYQCNSGSAIKIEDRLTLKFSGLRTQAFVSKNRFDTPEPCPADSQSSDLVPIIIGAVLAAIVLIVLIAYLIGRARMRRTTYESI